MPRERMKAEGNRVVIRVPGATRRYKGGQHTKDNANWAQRGAGFRRDRVRRQKLLPQDSKMKMTDEGAGKKVKERRFKDMSWISNGGDS